MAHLLPLAGLQAALDADPLDTTARLVLADWYEEQGDEEAAACMRWMAREGKQALHAVSPDGFDYGWGWTRDATPHPYYQRHALSGHLWKQIKVIECSFTSDWWRLYPTRHDAEAALLAAWRALPPSERPA